MRILGMKPGHDGAFALIHDTELVWSLEAEKDSGERHAEISLSLTELAMEALDAPPDVIAVGGWHRSVGRGYEADGAGYFGSGATASIASRWGGATVEKHVVSHERSHIFGTLAMSPGPIDEEMAVLVWEGVLGSFYHVTDSGQSIRDIPVLDQPGARYAALFALADPEFPDTGKYPPTEYAGKLMALAGCTDGKPPSPDSIAVVDHLLQRAQLYPLHKRDYRFWDCYNAGVTTPEFARTARYLSDSLFAIFATAAQQNLPSGLRLAVGGGCGLNCEWNRSFLELGWFDDVFVPPCPDDSGSAIGAAASAQFALTGSPTIDWQIDSGPAFRNPGAPQSGWTQQSFEANSVADIIHSGDVVAWVQGRCEIGPRALGHRSLLADPTLATSKKLLNSIKGREPYRPIAPLVAASVAGELFDGPRLDPYMLYFSTTRDAELLPAVTHEDGTARVQSLAAGVIPRLDELLGAIGARSGVEALCNTSLNRNGHGFFNRASDLFAWCEEVDIDHVVIDEWMYRRLNCPAGRP